MKLSVVISLTGAQLRNGTPRGKSKKRTSSPVCSDRSRLHTVGTEALWHTYSKATGGFKLTAYLHLMLRLIP
jgi:hypothetical protein